MGNDYEYEIYQLYLVAVPLVLDNELNPLPSVCFPAGEFIAAWRAWAAACVVKALGNEAEMTHRNRTITNH